MSQQTEVPSKALFHAWKHHEVTERLMRLMKEEAKSLNLVLLSLEAKALG